MGLSPAMRGERDKDRGYGGWLGGSRKKRGRGKGDGWKLQRRSGCCAVLLFLGHVSAQIPSPIQTC